MSYILDALRRADAERERGEVPSLHSQQYGALPGEDDRSGRPLLLIGVIVFLVLALGGALAWNFRGGSDTAPQAAAQGSVSTPLAPAAPPSVPAVAALPTSMSPAAPASAALPPPAPTPPAAPEVKSHRNATTATPTLPAAQRRHATRTAAPSAPAPEPGSSPDKLPETLRRELPSLAFGGASYSKDAASRMVIFNGRVFHEGDTIAPQLVLEQIKPKAAVLTYKGYRYEIAF